MTLLGKAVGFDPDAQFPDGAFQGETGARLTVTGGPLSRPLDTAMAFTRRGGGYAVALGAGAGLCELAHVPLSLDLVMVGACGMHAWYRVAEHVTWLSGNSWASDRARRKYQGEAGPREVQARLSPRAAVKKMSRLAPGLPASQAFITVGQTAHLPHQAVAVSRAETILVVGVPQSLKTALISNWVRTAPGVVLSTSSRVDQWRHTVAAREAMGDEVLVLDADGYGPGTTLFWDPVAGCADPRVAIRRSGDFMQASPRDPSGKDAWHEDRGAKLLRWALHAADLSGGNAMDVRRWVHDPEHPAFAKALRLEGAAEGWAGALESMLSGGVEYMNAAITSADAALGWMDDPLMASVACPPRGSGLDIARFLARGHGSVYLIGSERPHGSLTPLFSAFASEFMEQARIQAERQGGRLAVPLTIAADEAATTAKIDFARWCSVTAGYNITVIAGLQAISQLSAWGDEKKQETILTLFSTKVIAGGMTSPSELDRLSLVCGQHYVWRRENGSRVREKEPVFPAERIRLLPDFNALVVHRNTKPVQVVVTPVWDQPGYQEVKIALEPADDRPALEAA